MTVNGTEIEIFDGFEIEFGESIVFTENHLIRHHRHMKKEFNKDGICNITLKNLPIFDIPAKCILEFDKAGKLRSLSFKVKVVDFREANSADDAKNAANELAVMLVDKLVTTFKKTQYRTTVSVSDAPSPFVTARISES